MNLKNILLSKKKHTQKKQRICMVWTNLKLLKVHKPKLGIAYREQWSVVTYKDMYRKEITFQDLEGVTSVEGGLQWDLENEPATFNCHWKGFISGRWGLECCRRNSCVLVLQSKDCNSPLSSQPPPCPPQPPPSVFPSCQPPFLCSFYPPCLKCVTPPNNNKPIVTIIHS